MPQDCVFLGKVKRPMQGQGVVMELDRFEVPVIPGKAILGTKRSLEPSNLALLHPTAPAQHHERCDLGVALVFVGRELRRREVLDDMDDEARHHQMGSTTRFEP